MTTKSHDLEHVSRVTGHGHQEFIGWRVWKIAGLKVAGQGLQTEYLITPLDVVFPDPAQIKLWQWVRIDTVELVGRATMVDGYREPRRDPL